MKMKFTFKTEDEIEAKRIIMSTDAYYAIRQMERFLREKNKYQEYKHQESRDLISEIWTVFHEISSQFLED